jgi:hypothetical protein
MDSLLKLKLEILYKDLPIEQARQRFEELKAAPDTLKDTPVLKKRRKLRIMTTESK